MPLPFIHIWSVADDQVQAVFDYFAGIEVAPSRGGAAAARLARSGATPARGRAEAPRGAQKSSWRRRRRESCRRRCLQSGSTSATRRQNSWPWLGSCRCASSWTTT